MTAVPFWRGQSGGPCVGYTEEDVAVPCPSHQIFNSRQQSQRKTFILQSEETDEVREIVTPSSEPPEAHILRVSFFMG